MLQENRNPQIAEERWLDRYIYTEIHEIFFASFSTELYEWIARLADSQGRCRVEQPIVWTTELVHRIEAAKDKITWVVDHWLDQVIRGFITEFVINTTVSYNEAEWHFLKRP